MGHEILYCSSCAQRILGAEFEKGKALRVGHRVACGKCRPALLAELSPAERAALEAPATAPAAPSAPRPVPAQGSSTRLKHAPPGATSPPWIPVVAGVVLVVLLILGTLLTRKPPAPAPPVAKAAPGPRPPVAAPLAPVENPRLPAARLALSEARQSGADVEAAYAAWERAVRAADQTPLAGEAMQGYSQALERRRAAWKAAMDEGEREIRAALERKDGRAVRAVLEKLRGRHSGAEWLSKVDELGRRLERAIQDARPWTALFDGKTADCFKADEAARFTAEGGVLLMNRAGGAVQTRRQFADGELRVRFEITGGEQLYFSVRQGEAGFWQVKWDSSNAIAGLGGAVRELLFVMKGPEIRAALDGREVPGLAEGKPATGHLQFNCKAAGFRIHALEYRELP